MEEKLEVTKLRERIEWAVQLIKEQAKNQNLPFDKDLFLQACKLGETMFVRSEIQYSSRKA